MADESKQPRAGVQSAAENTSTEGDASLLRQIARGDDGAMAQLFERYSGLVFSVGLRVLKDRAQAEDVVQDVFMQMWTKPPQIDATRQNLGPLIAVIARNRSIDLLRNRKPTEPAEDVQLVSSFNTAGMAERHMLLDRVRSVAGSLPLEQKTVLDLAFFEGFTHVEIAQKTDTPLGTVKTRIRSALQVIERTLRV